MYNDAYQVNTTDHLKRKQAFEERVHAMIGYIKRSTGCRSRHIAAYFTDVKINPCGICDNCINEKVIHISTEEFNQISGQVIDCIKETPVSVDQILATLKPIKKEKIWEVINYMLAEEKIRSDKDGKLSFEAKS
jgi:ATP-dependent DNA helicase RecQ